MTFGLRVRFDGGDVAEPAHGVAMRLATRHGVRSVDEFLRDHAMSLVGLAGGRDVAAFTRRLGAPEGAIAAVDVDPRRRAVRFGGETLLLNDWSLSARRWCPLCLAEDLAAARDAGAPPTTACRHRAVWDLRSTGSCVRHRVALAETCPACGGLQGWDGPALDRCACGGDLAKAACRPLGPGEGACDAYVHGRLGAAPPIACAFLDDAELKDALASLERLGWAVVAGGRGRSDLVDRGARAIARDAGMAAAADWPRSFRSALDATAGSRAEDASDGLLAAYGWIYSEWTRLPPRTGLDREARRELARHAVGCGIVAVGEPLFGAEVPPSVCMTEAARAMRMDYSRARAVLDERGAIPDGVRRGVAFPLRPEHVPCPVERPAPAAWVRERLGVGRCQARAIGRVLSDGPQDAGWVDVLLDAAARGTPVIGAVPAGLVPLPRACKAARVDLATACRAIVDRDLRPVAALRGDGGLTGVLVRAGEVRRLSSRGGLSVEAAARLLALHPEAARWLVRRGRLATIPGPGIARIERGSVLAFGSLYAPAARLAVEHGLPVRKVGRVLARAGVVSSFGPPECRQRIFLRADAGWVLRAGTPPAAETLH